MKTSFIIAGTSSGSGKTTFSLGLMRLLRSRGLIVQPYKCGPDYIDPLYHGLATGRESVNLDLFMSGECHVRSVFRHYGRGADAAVVEGVMGMFDGYDGMKGSSAHLAGVLGLPVVLLVDAASASYSVAATIYGFSRLDPGVRVAGVVFNRVSSERHFSFLKAACRGVGVECFGYIRRRDGLKTPSRHLGLSLESEEAMANFIDNCAEEVGATVDVDALMSLESSSVDAGEVGLRKVCGNRVAVARDEAFSFTYRANIDSLGDDVVFFSPLRDAGLPEADIVYIPGGYPELYSRVLSANRPMLESVREYSERGGRIFGECGGLIYLGREIDGDSMCGVFPFVATMDDARLRLGYREVLLPGGETLRGHEFHYSRLRNPECFNDVSRQRDARGERVDTRIYRSGNTIAGYTHLYWAEKGFERLWEV